MAADDVGPEAVRAQVERIASSDTLKRHPTIANRMRVLVEMALAGRPEEDFSDWRSLEIDLFPDDEDRQRGAVGVRQEVYRVKEALEEFYVEEADFDDDVEIKITLGSRRPCFTPRALANWPHLTAEERRLLGKAKALTDLRTNERLLSAVTVMLEAMVADVGKWHPVLGANAAMVSCFATACCSLRAGLHATEEAASALATLRREPWESVYSRACLKALLHREWATSLALFERAAKESQGESIYTWWHTALLASVGRFGEAVELLDRAVSGLGRMNIGVRCDLAMMLLLLERYEEADALLTDTLLLSDEDDPMVGLYQIISAEAQDDLARASTLCQVQSSRMRRGKQEDIHPWLWGMFTLVLGRIGRSESGEDAKGCLRGAIVTVENFATADASALTYGAFNTALGRVGLGDESDAVELLRIAAFEQHEPAAMWFHIFPALRHLHGNREYEDLVKEIGLRAR